MVNFSKLTGKIYEIIEYSTFSSITNFQTVIFHTVSSTKSIPRNSQFLATRSDLWGRINCELRRVGVICNLTLNSEDEQFNFVGKSQHFDIENTLLKTIFD